MEKPLIVLLDVESGFVHLFGAFNRQLPVHDLYLLKPFLQGRNVIWVSEIAEVPGEEALEILEAVAEQTERPKGEPLFIHTILEGWHRATDVKVTFAGPKDCKPLDKLGYDIFEKSPQLSKMLMDGDIEIITESEARALRKPKKDLAKAKEDSLNSILIDNHEKAGEQDDIFTGDNDIDPNEANEPVTEAEEMIRRGYGKR